MGHPFGVEEEEGAEMGDHLPLPSDGSPVAGKNINEASLYLRSRRKRAEHPPQPIGPLRHDLAVAGEDEVGVGRAHGFGSEARPHWVVGGSGVESGGLARAQASSARRSSTASARVMERVPHASRSPSR